MLEDKVEELKQKSAIWTISEENNDTETHEAVYKKIHTKIDLPIGAFVHDSFFSSELDKLNFYREIESINNKNDLDTIIDNFTQLQNYQETVPKETQNLFNLLHLKIYADSFGIDVIKKA